MAKQGMIFRDNESGYNYSLRTANEIMTSDYNVVLPEKSGTLAMLDDLKANLTLVNNILTFTKDDGTQSQFDLSVYLDDTTNSIMSGTLDGTNIIFTRQDGTTFEVGVSALYDDSNIVTSVAGRTGVIELTKSDVGLSNVENTADANKVVASAGKLTNSVNINGIAFDGSIDITVEDNTKLGLTGGNMTGAIGNLVEKKVAMAANNIDLTQGNLFVKNVNANTTFTISGKTTTGNVNSFILELTNAGAYVITWFSGVKWASGAAPALTSAGVDVLGFYSHDGGTTWRGMVLSKDSK